MDEEEPLVIGDGGSSGLKNTDNFSYVVILLIMAALTYCFLRLCWHPKETACYSEDKID